MSTSGRFAVVAVVVEVDAADAAVVVEEEGTGREWEGSEVPRAAASEAAMVAATITACDLALNGFILLDTSTKHTHTQIKYSSVHHHSSRYSVMFL